MAVLFALALSGAAAAESLHDRIQRANGLLRSGEMDQALDSYHTIQVDHPDSPVLDYNIGCAEYEKAMKEMQSKEKRTDGTPLTGAIASFDRAIQSGDPAVSESAAFNRANCFAQSAKNAAPDTAQSDRTGAFYDAIRAYEDVLKADPANEGAKQNIDHLRYMLKKTPPPQPQQQGGNEDKENQDQSGQGQDQQQEQKNDPSQQHDRNNQQQQQDQDQPQNKNNTSQQEQDQDEKEQQQDETQPDSDPQQSAGASEEDNAQQQESPSTPDQQTVEALLQSLDDLDKEMQKELRQGTRAVRVPPNGWW